VNAEKMEARKTSDSCDTNFACNFIIRVARFCRSKVSVW
jgi:hypothetical protein